MTGLEKICISFLLFVALYFVAGWRARRRLPAERTIVVRKREIPNTKCVMCAEPSNGMPLCSVCSGAEK